MRNSVAILAFVAFLQARGITCTNIFKIDIKTADEINANTDDTINMRICQSSDCCETWLDNPDKNDFERGEEDTFGTSYFHQSISKDLNVKGSWVNGKWEYVYEKVDTGFKNCDNFTIATDTNPKVFMRIVGPELWTGDGWTGESVKITLHDGTTFDYTIEEVIDYDGKSETKASFQSKSTIAEPHAIANVEVKTRNDKWANTNHPIFMKICRGNVDDCCETQLDNPGINDFENGETDTFEPSTLNECETFEIFETPDVYMSIEGTDGWFGESVVIEMTTGEIYKCEINAWIDGDGKGTITTTTVPTCKKE